ncbi:MAG: hypothetical protein ABIE07_01250 [Candidatus Zixiibacteriota bacterium]
MAEKQEYYQLAEGQSISYWNSRVFAMILISLLAFILNWPYLLAGFSGDDVIFLNILKQDPLPFSRRLGMWSISASDWNFLDNVWWKDWTSSGGGFFWRPIPSLIFEGFVGVFGKNSFPLHILLILIHTGVGVTLYLFVRKLTRHHWLALAAGVFFITCEDHSILLGWITAFTGPLAVLFTVLALLAHVYWLQHRRPLVVATSLLMLLFAMACKESASVSPLIIMSFTFFMPTGTLENNRTDYSLLQRFKRFVRDPWSWAPAMIMLVIYLIVYKSLGLGTIGSLMYVSPFADPIGYISNLVTNLPIMWLGTFSPISPFLLMFAPSVLWIAAVLGTVFLVIWAFALWPFKKMPLVQWAILAYMVSLLPELATTASERGLYFAMIPASILLAMILLTIRPLAQRINPFLPAMNRHTRIVGWMTMWIILIPGTLLSLAMPWAYLPGLDGPEQEIRTALPHIEEHKPEHIIVLNTSGFMLTIYAYDIFNYVSEGPQDVWVLSSGNGVYSMEKTGDSSIVIRTDRSGWLDNMFARVIRTKSRLKLEDQYQTPLFAATLQKLTKSKRDVLEVQFDFDQSLDYSGYLFLKWNGEVFEPVEFENLLTGDTLGLADTSDLLKSMF